jgi:hypothetical protein
MKRILKYKDWICESPSWSLTDPNRFRPEDDDDINRNIDDDDYDDDYDDMLKNYTSGPSKDVLEDIDYIKTMMIDMEEDGFNIEYDISGFDDEGLDGEVVKDIDIKCYVTGKNISGDRINGRLNQLKYELTDYEFNIVGIGVDGSFHRYKIPSDVYFKSFCIEITRRIIINEELSPELLKRSGEKLINIGQVSRGKEMLNHVSDKSDVYNLNLFLNDFDKDNKIESNLIFKNYDISISFEKINHLETDINQAIECWKEGDQVGPYFDTLCISVEFNFKAIEGPILKEIGSEYSGLFDNIKIPVVFNISKEYDTSKNTIDFEVLTFPDSFTLDRSNSIIPGLFSDRKSALKFRGLLIDLLDDSVFREILTRFIDVAGGESDDYSDIIHKIKNIRVNYLYNDSGFISSDDVLNCIDLITGKIENSPWC